MPPGHDPTWPDKAMFAALLLVTGGILALAVEALRLVATVEDHLPAGLLQDYPHALSASAAAAMLGFGVVCYRTERRSWGYLGAGCGTLSLAYDGLAPLLSLVAVVLLVKSRLEGEETRNSGVRLHPSQWPDKAMAASLFMVVAAAVLFVQGLAIALDHYEPIVLGAGASLVFAGIAGCACVACAISVYRLRAPWLGFVAAGLAAMSMALVVLGPALGVAILAYMLLAQREDEFAKRVVAPGPVRPVAARGT